MAVSARNTRSSVRRLAPHARSISSSERFPSAIAANRTARGSRGSGNCNGIAFSTRNSSKITTISRFCSATLASSAPIRFARFTISSPQQRRHVHHRAFAGRQPRPTHARPDVQHPERDHSTHPHSKIDARANPHRSMRRHHPRSMIGLDRRDSSCRMNQLVPSRGSNGNRLMRQRRAPERHAEGPDLHMPVVIQLAEIRHRLAGYRIYGTAPRV